MIRTLFDFVSSEMESWFIERDPLNYKPGYVATAQAMVKPDGTVAFNDDNHITIMLVGTEEERREGKRPQFLPTDDKQFLRLTPPIELNLFLLFAAHNSVYDTALRDLSNVVGFFQSNPVFDSQKYPSLNASVVDPDKKPWQLIDRVTFKLHHLTFEQQNNMWGMLGAKYLPNVVYKVNMLTVFDTRGKDKIAAITELKLNEN